MTREAKVLWMKDILEHVDQCDATWAGSDPDSERCLAEARKRDQNEFRRACESLRTDAGIARHGMHAA